MSKKSHSILSLRSIYRIIFLLSLCATIGSLYYGYFGDPYLNILNGELFKTYNAILPCEMCWYIRIAQYPILLLSGIALFTKEFIASKRYILALSIFGLIPSVYKALLEYDFLGESAATCGTTPGVSCGTPTYLCGTEVSLAVVGGVLFLIFIALLIFIKNPTHE